MAGYSLTTLFVKLATRTGEFSAFACWRSPSRSSASRLGPTILSGAFAGRTAADFARPGALWAYAAGIVLTVAVGSLFKGLSLGPASVVVPIYGMFILGGAVLGILFLHEPATMRKLIGLALAIAGIYLVAR
jgi:EamA-like transporter family.